MSYALTGLIFGVGFGGWVYAQMMHRTGSTRNSVIVAVAAGAVGFLIIFTLMGIIFKGR